MIITMSLSIQFHFLYFWGKDGKEVSCSMLDMVGWAMRDGSLSFCAQVLDVRKLSA